MTEPDDDDDLRARLARLDPAAGVVVAPLTGRPRDRRRGALVAAAAALVLLAGAGIVMASSGGGSTAAPDVLAPETTSPAPSASPSQVEVTASPSPSPTAVPTTEPAPTKDPTPTPTASAIPTRLPTEAPSPTPSDPGPQVSEPPADQADQLAGIEVSVSPSTAAAGNRITVTVTLTNTSQHPLLIPMASDCGDAFGSIRAPGSTLSLGPGSDFCSGGPTTLAVGATKALRGFGRVQPHATAGTYDVIAEAYFTLSSGSAATSYTVTGRSSITLLSHEEGTRTFTVLNDLPYEVRVECPGCPGGAMVPAPTLEPGAQKEYTSSIFGEVGVTRVGSNGQSVYDSRTCFDPKIVPQGSTGTVIKASSAGPCTAAP